MLRWEQREGKEKCIPCGMEGLELRLIHLDGYKTKKWGWCVSGANSSCNMFFFFFFSQMEESHLT